MVPSLQLSTAPTSIDQAIYGHFCRSGVIGL